MCTPAGAPHTPQGITQLADLRLLLESSRSLLFPADIPAPYSTENPTAAAECIAWGSYGRVWKDQRGARTAGKVAEGLLGLAPGEDSPGQGLHFSRSDAFLQQHINTQA